MLGLYQLGFKGDCVLVDQRPLLLLDHVEELEQAIHYHHEVYAKSDHAPWEGLVCLRSVNVESYRLAVLVKATHEFTG